MNNPYTFVSKGNRSILSLMIASLAFALAVYFIYGTVTSVIHSEYEYKTGVLVLGLCTALLPVVVGIVFAGVRDYHFDFLRKKYKIVKRVGFIGFGSWQEFENLGYVSLSENSDGIYQIKLWYDRNQHFFIDEFKDVEDATFEAEKLAKELNIDFESSIGAHEVIALKSDLVLEELEDRKIDVNITEGELTIKSRVFGIVLLIAAILIPYFYYSNLMSESSFKGYFIYVMGLGIFLFKAGINQISTTDYLFDIKKKQCKTVYNIGPFSFGKWQQVRAFNYISINKKGVSGYELRLWYNSNKQHTLYHYSNFEEAKKDGISYAKMLEIDLADVSDPYNKKWVDLE